MKKISLDKLLCKLTGRRFRFTASIRYIPNRRNAAVYVSREVSFGVDRRDSATLLRDIRKAYGETLMANVPKHMLQNGILEVKGLSYLGWYK
ncbi:hypothetical protein BCT90_04380 [Vibrio lentus]|nr:hypothetical protein BCU41_02085 [Vibrio lentus]PMK93239.1 hypothetical protein BCT90_04380 [Vibrio lentus]